MNIGASVKVCLGLSSQMHIIGGFHRGVIHGFTHPCCFVGDYNCGLPCLRIALCCDCVNYCHCLYGLVCVSIWRDITFLARKMHDDAVGVEKNPLRVQIQLHRAVDQLSSAFGCYLPLSSFKTTNNAPRRWMIHHNALQSDIFPCCASHCDE